MDNIEQLTKDLPDPEGARRFYSELCEKSPSQVKKLVKNTGLLSDLLTISNYSPLLATTILQNPAYISWLERERKESGVREKDELVESLARFAMTNSQLDTNVLLARFRRRELIRIYLKDIRRLGTIAEITEEISNLADAILEYALRIARQNLDNRYGIPLEIDENNRAAQANFCVVALGKLGSRELNYSSDIDLLFIFSKNGSTSGQGSRDAISNKQYFVKLAELITKLVGDQTGEGAAYRVDMRLRPYGRVGALAITLKEAISYYHNSAQMWERQVLIRSRSAAGDDELFQEFFENVSSCVFSKDISVEDALRNVRRSKEKIDTQKFAKNGFDVKLGKGGIREIEFIAQALQLAFGGNDPWLRTPHTLISLSRIADRKLINEDELTELFDAYTFLRRVEHNLQMEHGLQTHFVPDDLEKRLPISRRMGITFVADFNKSLVDHTKAVTKAFRRIFGEEFIKSKPQTHEDDHVSTDANLAKSGSEIKPILSSIEKSDVDDRLSQGHLDTIRRFSEVSPPFSEMITANPELAKLLPDESTAFYSHNYRSVLSKLVTDEHDYSAQLANLRKHWARYTIEIAAFDIHQKIDVPKVRTLQTSLAEASINAATEIAKNKVANDFGIDPDLIELGVLGLGKLGGGGMDYGSDLDLVLVFDDEKPSPAKDLSRTQFYSKVVEVFVTALSSVTRDGSLYRVDLRLRPDGKNGATAIGRNPLLNYLKNRAAIWEWLAYVKLRGIGDTNSLAVRTESACRLAIHRLASAKDREELRSETWRIRHRLAKEKSERKKGEEIDIKFGEGGLQDVYFAVRYLQLRDGVIDNDDDRSTLYSLDRLLKNGSLTRSEAEPLTDGYSFLSSLDHSLRLSIGRSTRLPLARKHSLELLAKRMKLDSTSQLLETLTLHRLNVRSAFESILDIK